MLPNSQLHLLQKIEKRRRYRNWVAALQVAMVVFFADQIVKTWSSTRLEFHARQPVLGQTTLELTRVPRRGFLEERVSGIGSRWLSAAASQIPGAIFICLVLALWLRLPVARMPELIAFALGIAGAASNLLSLWIMQVVTSTFRLSLGEGRAILFNLADVALAIGGLTLVLRLTRTLVAEVRWVWSRQTG
jgi:lipoprotein signal peptidase